MPRSKYIQSLLWTSALTGLLIPTFSSADSNKATQTTDASQSEGWSLPGSNSEPAPPTETTESSDEDEFAIPETGGEMNEGVYVLPTFEVVSTSQDSGYYSANALAGTRTNQAIKDTPMTIAVVNEELMRDLGLNNISDITNVVASFDTTGANFSDREIRARGVVVRNQLFEFMQRIGAQDNYNVQRAEIIRGSNSLVYGQAAPGGKINFLTKKAEFDKDRYQGSTEFGTNDWQRHTFDANKQINDWLAVRIMGVHKEKELDQDYNNDEFDGLTAATTLRVSDRTRVGMHAEYYEEERHKPNGFFKDQSGQYGLTGVLQNLPATPDILKFLPRGALDYMIDYNDGSLIRNGQQPQVDINSKEDLKQLYKGITKNNSGTLQGPDDIREREGIFLLGDISHEFSENLIAKIAVAHEELDGDNLVRQEDNNLRLATQKNGKLRPVDKEPDNDYDAAAGEFPSLYATSYWQKAETEDDTDAIRATLSWTKEIAGSQQQLLLGFDGDIRESSETQWHQVYDDAVINDDGTFNDAWRVRDYFLVREGFDSDVDGIRYDNETSVNINPDANFGNNPVDRNPISEVDGKTGFWTLNRTRESEVTTTALWTALQGRYLDGRLNTLVGLRWDNIDVDAETVKVGATGTDEPFAVSETYEEFSPSLGALFWINKNIAIFGNYSESIESPNGWDLDPEGRSVKPELGFGKEGGFKFEFLNGDIDGQLVFFQIDKENENLNRFSDSQLSALYPESEYPELYPNGNIKPVGRIVPGTDVRSEGLEFDIYYNPSDIPGLSLYFGYAYIDAYYKDTPLDVATDETLPGTSKNNFTFNAKYEFKDGALKGFYLGGSQKYKSESYLGTYWQDIGKDGQLPYSISGDPNALDGKGDVKGITDGNGVFHESEDYKIWIGELWDTTAFVGWKGKLKRLKGKPRLTVQFTVDNLFDNREFVGTGRYQDGRRYRIKTSLLF